jgi:hypothetical protein
MTRGPRNPEGPHFWTRRTNKKTGSYRETSLPDEPVLSEYLV